MTDFARFPGTSHAGRCMAVEGSSQVCQSPSMAGLILLLLLLWRAFGLGALNEAHSQSGLADAVPPAVADGTAGSPPAAGPSSSPSLSGGTAGRDLSDGTTEPAQTSVAASGAGQSGRQSGGRDAAGIGTPGRQARPPSAAPALPLKPSSEPAVLSSFECPREAIARMLANARAPGEFSASLSLEREVLELCRDRQTVLKEIVASELQLAEVLRNEAAAREAEALRRETARQEAEARVAAVREELALAADAARAALVVAAEETLVVVEPELPDYAWFSILGRQGSLRAGIGDGAGVWFVEEGDELPGGVVVEEISSNPAGVTVEGAVSGPLPYRSRGGR